MNRFSWLVIVIFIFVTCYLLSITLFESITEVNIKLHTHETVQNREYRRSMLLSGNEPISPIPPGVVLPGVSYFNKIYNMLDGTNLLDKSGRDIYTFRYSSMVQTWTSQYSYIVPVEFAGIPNIYPQCTKDTTLSTMKKTWSSSIITDKSSSKSSGFSITLSQIATILSPVINAISPGVGTSISSIASSPAFKDAAASIKNGNARETKDARKKRGEGFEKTYKLSAESSLYEGTIAWDQFNDFDMKYEFKSAIAALEISATNSDILKFIKLWGTHVINSARMGAMCEESVYLKSTIAGYNYNDFYTYTKTHKSGILFWSKSSTTTTSITESGTYNSDLFYEFTSVRCEGECATSQSCGDMTGTGFWVKPVEYDLIPIWSVQGLMSTQLNEKFQLFSGNIFEALLQCRLNNCNNHGICTMRDDVFTSQFVMSWDGMTFGDMVDYSRSCYCDEGYKGEFCADSGYVSMNCNIDATYVTNWDAQWIYLRDTTQFPAFLSGVGSYHSNSKEDRRFKWKSCTAVLNREETHINSISVPANGQFTSWDGTWTMECAVNNAIIYMNSRHSNSKEDRIYTMLCASMNGIQTVDCYWTTQNAYDGTFWSECSDNGVITAIWSQHHNKYEDRRYKYKCCRFSYNT